MLNLLSFIRRQIANEVSHAPNNTQRESGDPGDPDNIQIKRSVTGTIKTNAGNSQFYNKFGITLHNTSIEEYEADTSHMVHRKTSSTSSMSPRPVTMKKITNLDDCGTKFPKLEECAHFHYDFIELGDIQVLLSNDNQENQSEMVFYIEVTSRDKTWTISRSYENLRTFDRQLHKCIFDRKFSLLPELRKNELTEEGMPAMKKLLILYLNRFTSIAGNMINCGPVLSWLELDNRGNRLIISDDSAINTPAVGAAHVVKRYTAQERDEISLEVGDIISIIDMPPKEESQWWRGKKGFEVGFFPAECVELIREKLPHVVTSKFSKPKPVLHKHGKLISLLRSFFSSRPARTQLKRSGIVKERVFGCDLGEHLLNTGREIPLVLEQCAETIETHGIVDGIYRLSGVASNIQKLRNEFDEERVPCLTDECYLQDIHSISSLLKAYFRDLPNPLFTFQLYDKFMAAIQDEENKLIQIHDVIQQLPPPHYRTAKYLMNHLQRISHHGRQTGMHCKNLAIVWAPNLLRSKDLELVCSTAALQGVGVQAIVTEYLISHADLIFSDQLQHLSAAGYAAGSLPRSRPKSLALSTPTKLLSLEEARALVNTGGGSPKQNYIEVGGGPANLPDRYHTVIDLPSKKKSRKDRKSPSGWRSLFSKKCVSSKGKDNEKADSVDSISSGAMAFTDDIGYDLHDGTSMRKLRSVRSADSLLNETNRQTPYSRLSADGGDSTTFVNPYADGYQPKQRRHYLDGFDSQRSASANNSYSESEMEPIIDVSPRDEVFMPSEMYNQLDRVGSLMSDIERFPECGSLPALSIEPSHDESTARPRSQVFVGSINVEQSSQPLSAKRSKSTTIGQPEKQAHFDPPTPAPRHISNNNTAKEHQIPKVKVSSPAKRKKAKAPLPPVAPPRIQQDREYDAAVDVERSSESLDMLVTVDLMESPGVKRKLYSGTVVELETDGHEGAPGQLASCDNSFTDDEAFNTQNLSLTTDSETEVEKRESLSAIDYAQDNGQQLMTFDFQNEADRDIISSGATGVSDPGDGRLVSLASRHDAGSGEMAHSYVLMEQSLENVLRDAADLYDGSEEAAYQGTASGTVPYVELLDSNSDGQVSGATMSTNFTTSSEIPCTSSTSEEDMTSREVYANSLGHSNHPHTFCKSLVDYSATSDSDTIYGRDQTTPVMSDPTIPFPEASTPSDSDTEVAKTPDPCSPITDSAENNDLILPHIELSDSEVVFVDPDLRQTLANDDIIDSDGVTNEELQIGESDLIVQTSAGRPQDLNVLTAPSVDQVSDLSPYSDLSDQIGCDIKSAARLTHHQVSNDGYLADRSCSASPAFVDSKDAQLKKTSRGKEQDVDTTAGFPGLDTVAEVRNEEREGVFQPETFSKDEVNQCQPVSCNRDLKKSSDSLLFEMEDLDSNQQKSLATSALKLNISSENEDEFFCPRAMNKQRTETNMSVSPEVYLEEDTKSEPRFEDIPRLPTATDDHSVNSQTTRYQMPSTITTTTTTTVSVVKPKSELCRKQSVRELLSRFESSTQSAESSDDGGRSSGSDVTGLKTGKLNTNTEGDSMIGQQQASNVGAKAMPRKPSEEISNKIRSIQSGYSSSEDSDPVRSGTTESRLNARLQCNSDTDRESDRELSSSPRIHDLRRRFEEKESLEGADREKRPPARQRNVDVTKRENQSKLEANAAVNEYQCHTELPSDIGKPTEAVTATPSIQVVSGEQQTSDSSDSAFGELRTKRSTLSERLQDLSERFKTYNEDPSAAPEQHNTATHQDERATTENRARPVPKPRSRTHRKPLTKGHFTRYDNPVKKETDSASGAFSGSGSENESTVTSRKPPSGSLLERRRKFERFRRCRQVSTTAVQ
ncbi:hypothetical protein LSH36_291g07014 [Paralvinella palmiformis]|uniref:Uncharacterized protein n=1 Tax=Paralvinella palmiformis TaxID=53620 RepID=A0AAD9JIJ6_9ANNE|nr:hypothetical protein LSH36_291g07014 [Paralvinella palmiformis]